VAFRTAKDKASFAAAPANISIAAHNDEQKLLKELAAAEEQAEALRRSLATHEHKRKLEAALQAMAEDYLAKHPDLT